MSKQTIYVDLNNNLRTNNDQVATAQYVEDKLSELSTNAEFDTIYGISGEFQNITGSTGSFQHLYVENLTSRNETVLTLGTAYIQLTVSGEMDVLGSSDFS